MKLDRIKSKGICAVLVPCLLFSALTLVGREDVEAENSDVSSPLTKVFAPGTHMFAEKQQCVGEISQYDGYEVFDIESISHAFGLGDLIVTYVNTVEVEAVAAVVPYGVSYSTPGIPTQKEQENQKVYTK